MTPGLLDLPQELVHAILVKVEPPDLASLRCCRGLNQIIHDNELLYKQVYLSHFVSYES